MSKTAPRRVQLRRTKGWRMPPHTVKVDRTTRWGNPFVIGVDGDQAWCVQLHRRLLENGPLPAGALTPERVAYRTMVLRDVHELHGQNLACWCKDGTPCHADVLLEMAGRD
ncbi:MAG: DUF4326 domain-containing protein [Flavobacteriales bacterium]